ncbi:MAG: HAD-IIIC family phosphatase [bacterium]|nr:HAD-IIIC family phosphatase [bacterium]
MGDQKTSCLLISDFNLGNLSGYLGNDDEAPSVVAKLTPFGQVMPSLLDAGAEAWRDAHDLALVWTRPEGVIESFAAFQRGESHDLERPLEEVDSFCRAIEGATDRVKAVLVATWTIPGFRRGTGLCDLKGGLGDLLMRMNHRLIERLRDVRGVWVIDSRRWMEAAGSAAYGSKYWYMAKIPFSRDVFKEATADIKAALRTLAGDTRKLIVLDLDDTLWGGVVGDEGWQSLTLGGHDPVGEAFCDFQRELRALSSRGVLLAIASKNDEAIALEALRKHEEMCLRESDFVARRINWSDKAHNIAEIVSELNLGLQSVVFIDDNPAERARVREALPEVLVPEWPKDPMLYSEALLGLRCFDSLSISDEDRHRTEMYASESERGKLLESIGSVEEWLSTLQLRVQVEKLGAANLKRTVQLLNKTNQMNLSTRRITEAELGAWQDDPAHELWTFRVEDRFADSGLTGIASLRCSGDDAKVVDFVLSCRVFGRKIERVMMHTLVEHARSLGAKRVEAEYLPTAKNKPCLEFLGASGLERIGEGNTFVWDTLEPYPLPDAIQVRSADS